MVRLAIEMLIGLLVVIWGMASLITSPLGKNAGKSAPPMLPKTELALGANASVMTAAWESMSKVALITPVNLMSL